MTRRAINAADDPVDVELTEEAAIAALLERLPHADAGELVALARTCPAADVRESLTRLERCLTGLRERLTAVVAEAHRQAAAAEAWIASLEALAAQDLAEADNRAESAA